MVKDINSEVRLILTPELVATYTAGSVGYKPRNSVNAVTVPLSKVNLAT